MSISVYNNEAMSDKCPIGPCPIMFIASSQRSAVSGLDMGNSLW